MNQKKNEKKYTHTGKLREKHYRVKPFDYLLAGDQKYIDALENYENGNSMKIKEEVMGKILESICSVNVPTKDRICGVRLRETESEEGISLELWMYSVQDTETGRFILEVEESRAYAPALCFDEYELACEDEAGIFLLATDKVCCGVPAFGGRAAAYAQKKKDFDISCEIFLAISWEDAEDLIQRLFEIEEGGQKG